MERDSAFPAGTFLHYLPAADRERLLALGAEARYPAGRTLIRQGERHGPVFVLLSGVTKVTAQVENGSEALLAVRVGGDVVGDMAPLTDSPRSASVVTCGECRVSVVRAPVFLDFVARSGPAGLAMTQFVVERLRWANQRRIDLAGYEAAICLARLLLTLSERHGRTTPDGLDIGVPLTQAELGTLIGVREATVHKTLRDLERRGLVRRGLKRVLIMDLPGLITYAEMTDEPG
ncbi:Crp/Fnr family transcriptional regulator [Nonomuraea rhizosphaerae]|uniref:Crp/Fnr family transcriptional regulator n=1 Tax=Nonomuraea rhizosphaerae TaxID=2665663 RepID=UPI001C5F215C|nr:Crp/Fnr family transcriptional regulator [Nonomuraea rhizosphaerae]